MLRVGVLCAVALASRLADGAYLTAQITGNFRRFSYTLNNVPYEYDFATIDNAEWWDTEPDQTCVNTPSGYYALPAGWELVPYEAAGYLDGVINGGNEGATTNWDADCLVFESGVSWHTEGTTSSAASQFCGQSALQASQDATDGTMTYRAVCGAGVDRSQRSASGITRKVLIRRQPDYAATAATPPPAVTPAPSGESNAENYAGDPTTGINNFPTVPGSYLPLVNPDDWPNITTGCYSISPLASNTWCTATCNRGVCPDVLCKCLNGTDGRTLTDADMNPHQIAECHSVASQHIATDDWCVATCASGVCPSALCECTTYGDLRPESQVGHCFAKNMLATDGWCEATCGSAEANCDPNLCECRDEAVVKQPLIIPTYEHSVVCCRNWISRAYFVHQGNVYYRDYDGTSGAIEGDTQLCAEFIGANDIELEASAPVISTSQASNDVGMYVSDYVASTISYVPKGCGTPVLITSMANNLVGPAQSIAIYDGKLLAALHERVIAITLNEDHTFRSLETLFYNQGNLVDMELDHNTGIMFLMYGNEIGYIDRSDPSGATRYKKFLGPSMAHRITDIGDMVIYSGALYFTMPDSNQIWSCPVGSLPTTTGFAGNNSGCGKYCVDKGVDSDTCDDMHNPWGIATDCNGQIVLTNKASGTLEYMNHAHGPSATLNMLSSLSFPNDVEVASNGHDIRDTSFCVTASITPSPPPTPSVSPTPSNSRKWSYSMEFYRQDTKCVSGSYCIVAQDTTLYYDAFCEDPTSTKYTTATCVTYRARNITNRLRAGAQGNSQHIAAVVGFQHGNYPGYYQDPTESSLTNRETFLQVQQQMEELEGARPPYACHTCGLVNCPTVMLNVTLPAFIAKCGSGSSATYRHCAVAPDVPDPSVSVDSSGYYYTCPGSGATQTCNHISTFTADIEQKVASMLITDPPNSEQVMMVEVHSITGDNQPYANGASSDSMALLTVLLHPEFATANNRLYDIITSSSSCVNSAGSALDKNSKDCNWYYQTIDGNTRRHFDGVSDNLYQCGYADDADFTASAMCCACNGGTRTTESSSAISLDGIVDRYQVSTQYSLVLETMVMGYNSDNTFNRCENNRPKSSYYPDGVYVPDDRFNGACDFLTDDFYSSSSFRPGAEVSVLQDGTRKDGWNFLENMGADRDIITAMCSERATISRTLPDGVVTKPELFFSSPALAAQARLSFDFQFLHHIDSDATDFDFAENPNFLDSRDAMIGVLDCCSLPQNTEFYVGWPKSSGSSLGEDVYTQDGARVCWDSYMLGQEWIYGPDDYVYNSTDWFDLGSCNAGAFTRADNTQPALGEACETTFYYGISGLPLRTGVCENRGFCGNFPCCIDSTYPYRNTQIQNFQKYLWQDPVDGTYSTSKICHGDNAGDPGRWQQSTAADFNDHTWVSKQGTILTDMNMPKGKLTCSFMPGTCSKKKDGAESPEKVKARKELERKLTAVVERRKKMANMFPHV